MDVRDSPESPIRIAFILHTMQVAGAEMLVAEIIRRLGARLAPVVICLDDVGQLGETMRAQGVPVVALGRKPGLDLGVARRLSHEIHQRRIEIVHAHQYTPFFYAALARLLGRRFHLLFTEHGRHYPDLVSAKRRVINRCLLSRLADEITAVCEFSARSLATIDGFSSRAIDVIRNGIDVPDEVAGASRHEVRLRLGLATDRRYVISVARFHPVKDHATLLRAFATVVAELHDVDLLLAGDGPLRPDLEALAEELGVRAHIQFLGVRGDVPALLRAADVFVLNSVSEAASLTVLEAMALACPVVVTAVGGNPEIVRSDIEGILVPRGNAGATSAALLGLLQDPDKRARMGEAGRHRVHALYRLEDTVGAYLNRYTAAIAALRQVR